MAPRRRAITDTDADEETLISAVSLEEVIWDESNKNKDNGYLVSKAWDNVAKVTQCTKQSIIKKWEQLRKERKDLKLKLEKLRSTNAGGAASRSAVTMHYSDQLAFLDDKGVPVVESSGNLDALVKKCEPTGPVVQSVALSCTKNVVTEELTCNPEMTDLQFCCSMLKDMNDLDDETKLDLRIDVMELLGQFSEKIDFSDDEGDITVLGTFTPEKQQ